MTRQDIIDKVNEIYKDEFDVDYCEEYGYHQISRHKYEILDDEFSSLLTYEEHVEIENYLETNYFNIT